MQRLDIPDFWKMQNAARSIKVRLNTNHVRVRENEILSPVLCNHRPIIKLAGPTRNTAMILSFWTDGSGIFGWLCWGLTSQSTIFQSCRDGAIASWVINQYFRGVKCLAQGHNTAAVGLEPRTSRSGVRHSTTEPPRSPRWVWENSADPDQGLQFALHRLDA